jgi:Zn ribbon nucleic-acid-binding protein
MGSVIDYIECPNCKQEAFSDFYYKTGEEYINCQHCGYHYSATIINREKKLNELTDDDWKIDELKNPYGAYRVKHYSSIATECGSLASENDYNKFCSEITSFLNQENEIEFASISRFIDGSVVAEVIVDNGPKTDSAGFTMEDNYVTI